MSEATPDDDRQTTGPPSDASVDVRSDRPPTVLRLRDAIGSLIGFVVLSIAVALLGTRLGMDPIAASALATAAGWLSLAGWPLYAVHRRGGSARTELGLQIRWGDLGFGALGTLVGLVVASIFVLLYLNWTGDEPTSALGDVAERAADPWQTYVLIGIALGAPLVEEIHFRGLWWAALRRRGLSTTPTVLVTSVLFAGVHLELERGILLFLLGLVLAYLRAFTRRLGAPIVMHLGVNGLAAIGLLATMGG